MEPDRRKSLIAALSSSDEEVRRSSMEELKCDLAESDLEWLVLPLSDDSWRVRKEAIEGLTGLTPTEDLVAAMIPMMDPTRELTLRNSVVEALEGIGSNATPFLILHLHVDQPDTRKFLVDILGNIADISTIPNLVGLLGDDEDNIRAAAAEALASIGDSSVAGPLMEAIADADEWVIFSILGALDKLRCPEALPVFFQYLTNQILAKPSLSGIGSMGGLSDGVNLMAMVPDLSRGAAKASFPAVGAIYRNHAAGGFQATVELREAVAGAAEENMVDFLVGQLSVSDQLEKRQNLLAVLGMVATLLFAVAGTAAAADPGHPATFGSCPGSADIPDPGFTDTAGITAEGDIDCIAYYGVTTGTSATTYSPDLPVIRQHMALFLARAAGPAGVVLDPTPPASSTSFWRCKRS